MSILSRLQRFGLISALALAGAPAAEAGRIYIDFGDGNFATSGNNFTVANTHELDLRNDGSSVAIPLGFDIDIGTGSLVSEIFINENGIVSFGSALPAGSFASVASLAALGVPVIAPFYSDLQSTEPNGNVLDILPGEIFYSPGFADPFRDSGGAFNLGEQVPAFRVTWAAITSAADPSASIYTQLYLYSAGGGDFDFRLSYGNSDPPGADTPALDSLAGISVGTLAASTPGPFALTTDYLFSVKGGKLVSSPTTPPTTTVSEPTLPLAAVAGLAAFAMFYPRRRRAVVRG